MFTHMNLLKRDSNRPPLTLLNPTMAISLSRILISGYGGVFYTTDGSGDIDLLKDQTGNGFDLKQGGTLTAPNTSFGTKGRTASLMTGSNWFSSQGYSAMDDLITADEAYLIMTVAFDNTVEPTTYASALWRDSINVIGQNQQISSVGATPSIQSFNNDGATDSTTYLGTTNSASHVIEFLHTGGQLTTLIDGVASSSVSSGDTTNILNFLYWGQTFSRVLNNGYFELATFKNIPVELDRTHLRNDMLAWAS